MLVKTARKYFLLCNMLCVKAPSLEKICLKTFLNFARTKELAENNFDLEEVKYFFLNKFPPLTLSLSLSLSLEKKMSPFSLSQNERDCFIPLKKSQMCERKGAIYHYLVPPSEFSFAK